MDARTGVIVMFCLIGFTFEEMVEFESCSSSKGVSSVDVVPCNSEPCLLHRGHNYTVSVTFTSPVNSRTSRVVFHGVVFEVLVYWPIRQENGCKSRIRCPLKKKETYTYVGSLIVKPDFPLVKLDVQWELKNDHVKKTLCVTFPAQIAK